MSTLIENLIEQKINEKIEERIDLLIDKALNKAFGEEDKKGLDELVYPSKDKNLNNNLPILSFDDMGNVSIKHETDEEFVKNEFENYLKTLAEGLNNIWKDTFDYSKKSASGLFKLNKDKDNYSEEDKAFIKYLATLTWAKLQIMITNNASINLEGLWDDNDLMVPKNGPAINTYYAIVKNTLYKRLSNMLEISIDTQYGDKDSLNTIIKSELNNSMNNLLETIIFKHNKEIFDYLFGGKIYLEDKDV